MTDLRKSEKFSLKNKSPKNFRIRAKPILHETKIPLSVDPYKIVPRGGNKYDFDSEGVHGSVRKRVEFRQVMEDFLCHHPAAVLFFTGSTMQRSRIYAIILKRYYSRFAGRYDIMCVRIVDGIRVEVPFSPEDSDPPAHFKVFNKLKAYEEETTNEY